MPAPLSTEAYDLTLDPWCPFYDQKRVRPWVCHTYAAGENDAWCRDRADAGSVDGVAFYFGAWGGDGRCGCPCCKREDPAYCDSPVHGADAELTGAPPDERSEAQAWFDAEVSVFVINMPSDRERLQGMMFKMAEQDIDFQVSPGILVSDPEVLREAKENDWVPADFNSSHVQKGTMGCAAAHRRAEATAMAQARRTKKPLVLIVEDDAQLVTDFKVKLYRVLHSEMPCDWDVLNLATLCPHGRCVSKHLFRVSPNYEVPAERCHKGSNYATYALLYRVERLPHVRSLLKQTMWDPQRPLCLDIDVALSSISDKIAYYAVSRNLLPGFVWTDNAKSHRLNLNE
eukprot:CAMPEP_0198519092 /NCGR_PEP_ID=MMETSP1462-20131121/19510_1 /TAXON_ID=1333877 /ORGANISM="Brandtodinium nutriculum, Strain RCC3387" /LENGTH=342 /DNA_ID=CAMNT_0044248695 /DNA_START=1 /DNA_END=1029 /DNA_ORIENTATION=+